MPAAVAVPAAISAGTSIVGGILGSRAANKAGRMQQEEALRQAQGFRDVLSEYNPRIYDAAEGAATGVLGASGAAGERALEAARTGAAQVRSDALAANELLDPYADLGAEGAASLREFMAPGGAGSRQFTAQDMRDYDPGYRFRLDEAARAVQASAAARGGALGGGALAALQRRSQDLASSEFGAANERFRQQQNDRYSRLFGVTELGGRYAGQQGTNLMEAGRYGSDLGMRGAEYAGNMGMQGAQYAGTARMGAADTMAQNAFNTQRSLSDLMPGGAAARSAGTMGSANAWSGALGGVANAAGQVGSYYQQKDLINSLPKPGFQYWDARPKYTPPAAGLPTPSYPYTNPASYAQLYGGAASGAPLPQAGYYPMPAYPTRPYV